MTHFLPYMLRSKNFKMMLAGIAVLAVFLLMVWARVFYGSMQDFREGVLYLQKGEYIKAVTFFDRSMHWYAPINPHVHQSAERLWEIGEDARKRGDIRLALIAVGTIRRGFVAARSFYQPGGDWIEKCDRRILALQELARSKNKGDSFDESPGNGSMLEDPQVRGPDIFWSIVLLAGLLGWIGSAIALILTRLQTSHKNRVLNVSNFKWIGIWMVCFMTWVVGMIRA